MWLQWAWGLAGVLAFGGAIIYILGIFWPYLRWTRAMMQRSFELGLETAEILEKIEQRVGPLVRELESLVKRGKRIMDEIEPELGIEKVKVDPITGKSTPVTVPGAKPGRLSKIGASVERIVKWLDPEEDPDREAGQGADELEEDKEFTARIEANKKRRKKNASHPVRVHAK